MHQQGGLSDADLVRWALGAPAPGERKAAFGAIADKYRQDVLRQCARWYPDPDTAQDVGQAAFEAAFTLLTKGQGPAAPDRLGGWLIEIARRRGQEYIRKRRPTGVYWAELPEGGGLEETEDDDESRSGSASRRAHVTRLVDRVVATLTEQQQEIYRLRFVEELTGRQAAAQLGITDKAASNEATIVQKLIADGFGALILVQEGRTYCPDLARILEDAAATRATAVASSVFATPQDMFAFTAVLRQRVVNHFTDCNVCDNCRTCDDKRRQLVGPYAPALIPILFAAEFRDRIDEVIRRVVARAHPEQGPPKPEAQGPGAAAALAVPLAMAGTAAASGAGGALASWMQSLVRAASQSSRTPHWLRRALPHDPSPRLSVAIVTSAIAAVIVLVIVIAVAATGSGSANPEPLAASGNGVPGATGTASTGALPTYSVGTASSPNLHLSAADCFNSSGLAAGTAALPFTGTTLAASVSRQAASCYGTLTPAITATCRDPNVYNGDLSYVCFLSDTSTPIIHVNPATGVWQGQ